MARNTFDDPDLALSELMRRWPATIPVFLGHRMKCVGCLVGPFHTIADACREYGLEETELLAELRAAITDAALRRSSQDHGAHTRRSDAARRTRSRISPTRSEGG